MRKVFILVFFISTYSYAQVKSILLGSRTGAFGSIKNIQKLDTLLVIEKERASNINLNIGVGINDKSKIFFNYSSIKIITESIDPFGTYSNYNYKRTYTYKSIEASFSRQELLTNCKPLSFYGSLRVPLNLLLQYKVNDTFNTISSTGVLEAEGNSTVRRDKYLILTSGLAFGFTSQINLNKHFSLLVLHEFIPSISMTQGSLVGEIFRRDYLSSEDLYIKKRDTFKKTRLFTENLTTLILQYTF